MRSRLPRVLATALLLLVVSPITAPFSTCDLKELFGHPVVPGPSSLHAKAAADEPVVDVASPLALHGVDREAAGRLVLPAAHLLARQAGHVQLRV